MGKTQTRLAVPFPSLNFTLVNIANFANYF